METIKINEKEYILKEDVEEKYVLKSGKVNLLKFNLLMDDCKVTALGSAELGEDYIVARYEIDYLLKGINVMKSLGHKRIDFALASKMPCVLGKIGKDGRASGFILAPVEFREDED